MGEVSIHFGSKRFCNDRVNTYCFHLEETTEIYTLAQNIEHMLNSLPETFSRKLDQFHVEFKLFQENIQLSSELSMQWLQPRDHPFLHKMQALSLEWGADMDLRLNAAIEDFCQLFSRMQHRLYLMHTEVPMPPLVPVWPM
jgi:hypothetical protein